MKTSFLTAGISFFLVLLWTYTGLDKLLSWQQSWNAFHNQAFPAELAAALSYAVPAIELVLAGLLVFGATRWWGLVGSVILLTVFNTYVGLIWWGAFPRVPCNCAGILESMGWASHFWLNSGLIGLGIIALAYLKNIKTVPEVRLPVPSSTG